MGHYLHLGVAKFVCHNIELSDEDAEIFKCTNLFIDKNNLLIKDEEFPLGLFIHNKWTWQDNHYQIKDVVSDLWIKDSFQIYIINESQYSQIGQFDMAIGAHNKESLLEFIKDFNITNFTIEENDAIQWWF